MVRQECEGSCCCLARGVSLTAKVNQANYWTDSPDYQWGNTTRRVTPESSVPSVFGGVPQHGGLLPVIQRRSVSLRITQVHST
ncbi:hypothetical protein ACOMHN_002507 [Nucella lapillus]